MNITNGKGDIIGAVCIVKSKDPDKYDIMFMPKSGEDGALSVRSLTELINKLQKEGISFEERKRVLNYASERLWYLENKLKLALGEDNGKPGE